jgi:hypothetical protein
LLGLTAGGLFCYGLFCLVDARYRDVSTNSSLCHKAAKNEGATPALPWLRRTRWRDRIGVRR